MNPALPQKSMQAPLSTPTHVRHTSQLTTPNSPRLSRYNTAKQLTQAELKAGSLNEIHHHLGSRLLSLLQTAIMAISPEVTKRRKAVASKSPQFRQSPVSQNAFSIQMSSARITAKGIKLLTTKKITYEFFLVGCYCYTRLTPQGFFNVGDFSARKLPTRERTLGIIIQKRTYQISNMMRTICEFSMSLSRKMMRTNPTTLKGRIRAVDMAWDSQYSGPHILQSLEATNPPTGLAATKQIMNLYRLLPASRTMSFPRWLRSINSRLSIKEVMIWHPIPTN